MKSKKTTIWSQENAGRTMYLLGKTEIGPKSGRATLFLSQEQSQLERDFRCMLKSFNLIILAVEFKESMVDRFSS